MPHEFECMVESFDDSNVKYLEHVSRILSKYSWIYNVRNIDIFLHDVLENIPLEWVEALTALSCEDLGKIPFDLMKDEWPDMLKLFIEQCQLLGEARFPSKNWAEQNFHKPQYTVKKASFKKQYEIEIMSSLISNVCQEFSCFNVLDIGSGLGYLDQILHHQFGLRCICLDSSAKYTSAAKERLKNDPCIDLMVHKTLEVKYSVACLQELKDILKEDKKWKCSCNTAFQGGCHSELFVLVGLHSCGNLMQDMMKLFCQMDELVAFVCVGCCYNKVNLTDFPMSLAAKSVIKAAQVDCPDWSPCVSGLRLAAHGTRSLLPASLMDSHLDKNLFYRALLEYYVKTENIQWRQPKRHLRPTDIVDFETYCTKMLEQHPLSNDKTTLKGLSNLYQQKKHLLPRIKILLVLQTLLQPLWEGFVTVDRMLYFKERNFSSQVISIWDDAKSCRNLALCAYKT